MTQQEQIKVALRAYIMTLSNSRYAIYTDDGTGLKPVWPSDSHLGKKSEELLDTQVYSSNRSFPAFHFRISDIGTRHAWLIREDLKKVNANIEVYEINGSCPTKV